MVIAIIGILVALLLPAIQAAREAARRTQCINHMKQIGLAVLNYESAHGELPKAFTPNWIPSPRTTIGGIQCGNDLTGPCPGVANDLICSNGLANHYILSFILPYLEYQSVFDQIDFSRNWDAAGVPITVPGNIRHTEVAIPEYLCPSAPARPNRIGAADYLTLVDVLNHDTSFGIGYCTLEATGTVRQRRYLDQLEGMLTDAGIKMRQVTDGLSKTLMFFECAGRPIEFFRGQERGEPANLSSMKYRWADREAYGTWWPQEDCGLTTVMNCSNWDNIYSFHPSGAIVLYGDGSAGLLSESIDVDAFVSLFTRAGGDVADSL